jgi:hypothetical protein
MQQHPDLFDPRAVLRAVKAWPGNTSASRNVIATASLDGPCARGAAASAGRDEGTPPGANKGTVRSEEIIDDVA